MERLGSTMRSLSKKLEGIFDEARGFKKGFSRPKYTFRILSLMLLLYTNESHSKILVIGDSHSAGPWGRALTKYLDVDILSVCSSNSRHWVTRRGRNCGVLIYKDGSWKKFKKIPVFHTNRYDLTIIALGTNGSIPKYDSLLLSKIDSKYIWVGPPDLHKIEIKQIYESLRTTVEDCRLFDSRTVTRYFGKDGIHYSGVNGERMANRWALEVSAFIYAKP